MKFRVKLKTTVYAWTEVEIPTEGFDDQGAREWAADEGLGRTAGLTGPLKAAGLEYGPVRLAYEELDESVEVVA